MKTHTALSLIRAPFQHEAKKSHIFQRKTQLLVFSRMLSFLTARSERAARWSVSVYAAELSPFTPFVSSREGGCVKPVQIHFFKAVPFRLSNLNPAHPVNVKLCERDKGAQLQYATHTALEDILPPDGNR